VLAEENEWWTEKPLSIAESVFDDLLYQQDQNRLLLYPQWQARLTDGTANRQENEMRRMLQVTMKVEDKALHRILEQQRMFLGAEMHIQFLKKHLSDLLSFRRRSFKVYLDFSNGLLARIMGNIMEVDPPGGRGNPSL
jgi:hypothetical protein